jgi:2-(1,2-epoxy-1,2-dihydrophenyl)acetyl-CoA isomerase
MTAPFVQTRPLVLTRKGDIAIISLSRPDAGNAIDMAFTDALKATAAELAQGDWARAIVLRAEGRLFCGGGDVGAFGAYIEEGRTAEFQSFLGALAHSLHDGIEALLALDAPLISAVQGAAAGAGMSLALAADFTYATPKAKFVPAYPGIGFSADGGMSWFLPRIVGERRAAQIMIANEAVDAAKALELGMVAEIITDEDFDAAVLARAETLAQGPRRAVGVIRRLIRQSLNTGLHDQLHAEAKGMAALSVSADVAEGLTALKSKRKPVFKD